MFMYIVVSFGKKLILEMMKFFVTISWLKLPKLMPLCCSIRHCGLPVVTACLYLFISRKGLWKLEKMPK